MVVIMSTVTENLQELDTANKSSENGKIENETHHDSIDKGKYKAIEKLGTDFNYKHKIYWLWTGRYILFQGLGLWGLYLAFTVASWKSILFVLIGCQLSVCSVSIAAHRLYSHKAFKPSTFLKILLIFFQTSTGQDSCYYWARDHRLHHKFSDTDADPYNAARGFFFSHMGWLFVQKHPLVLKKGKEIDVSDILNDPIAMFQHRHYMKLYILTSIIYVATPMYFWNESFKIAFLTCYMLINAYGVQAISTINSIAHYYGTKPFDKNIYPVESFIVTFLTSGEGWHNYHHSFPRDYRASEFGAPYNISARLIELFAFLGLATDLKTAPDDSVRHKTMKQGDGSHPVYGKKKHLNQYFGNLAK